MGKQTALYDLHRDAGAQLVDFAGWDMPLHYGSQIQEHQRVRESVGMFDVSHMGVVDIEGKEASTFLRYALANDVARLQSPKKALYSCMLNEKGGVIDDLIVYWLAKQHYRIIFNAGTRDRDVQWLHAIADAFEVQIEEKADFAIVAVQGPQAIPLMADLLPQALATQLQVLRPFEFLIDHSVMIARTGYTGEEGVEIILPAGEVTALWQDLLNQDVMPCGLGARDTLRLEAGYNLYGSDMTEETSPLVSNLSWTVSFKDTERDFVGRSAIEKEKERGVLQKLVGLVMQEPGVLRDHQAVYTQYGEGEITSGSFSPTLGYSIALARVPIQTEGEAEVERRGKRIKVAVVKPPFVKKQA